VTWQISIASSALQSTQGSIRSVEGPHQYSTAISVGRDGGASDGPEPTPAAQRVRVIVNAWLISLQSG
jgi:hypothetical protein